MILGFHGLDLIVIIAIALILALLLWRAMVNLRRGRR